MVPFKVKEGVKLNGLQPEMIPAIFAAWARFEQVGAPYVMITSALDGTHSQKSLHYKGLALDFRTNHITPEKAEAVVKAMKMDLDGQYDIVLESTHIHVEFDPK